MATLIRAGKVGPHAFMGECHSCRAVWRYERHEVESVRPVHTFETYWHRARCGSCDTFIRVEWRPIDWLPAEASQ